MTYSVGEASYEDGVSPAYGGTAWNSLLSAAGIDHGVHVGSCDRSGSSENETRTRTV